MLLSSSFCSSHGTRRDIHSFPTRRSSDLLSTCHTTSTGASPGGGVPTATMAPPGSRDRKSTRLNSSHRCISYAVFCLKIKKEIYFATYLPDQSSSANFFFCYMLWILSQSK